MRADGLLQELTDQLGSAREAQWLLDEVDALDPVDRQATVRELAARRASGEPLQYVLGHWPFRTLDLLVDSRALIPRPETELIVDAALVALGNASGAALVCDLGCGSGAIALSISVESRAAGHHVAVVAIDLSRDALDLAKENATRNGASAVTFLEGSWFDALPTSMAENLDVCCANPPYIAASERPALARELDFEPPIALVAGDGTDGTPGFAEVEAIVLASPQWLAPGGTLLVEHGDRHREAAVACCERAGLCDVVDHDDLAGRPRLIEARRPT